MVGNQSALIAKGVWATVYFINAPTGLASRIPIAAFPALPKTPLTILACRTDPSPPSPGAVLWAGPLTLATIDGPFLFCWEPCKPPRIPCDDSYSGGCFAHRGFP